ncbi:formylglycine-generating enzyme family protein, partial [Rubellimicrobium rubrum]
MKLSTVAVLLLVVSFTIPVHRPGPINSAGPEMVTLAPGAWSYRASGTWHRDGRQVDPPRLALEDDAPFSIMRHQVSRGEYAACVADGACLPSEGGPADEPRTQVSWHDAQAYASWLSKETGQTWRLPTDAEWQRAAAERFTDDALGDGDLSDRWLARYAQEAEAEVHPVLRLLGGWGTNSLGIADLAGNVWEWTNSCAVTGTLDSSGRVLAQSDYCGARIVEGR